MISVYDLNLRPYVYNHSFICEKCKVTYEWPLEWLGYKACTVFWRNIKMKYNVKYFTSSKDLINIQDGMVCAYNSSIVSQCIHLSLGNNGSLPVVFQNSGLGVRILKREFCS